MGSFLSLLLSLISWLVLSVICHAQVGVTQLMTMVESLLQLLLSFYTTQVHRVEELRSLLVAQLTSGIQALKVLPPVQQMLTLPTQVRAIMNDLLELGQILIQLLINTTPLYDLVRTRAHTHTHTQAQHSRTCSKEENYVQTDRDNYFAVYITWF